MTDKTQEALDWIVSFAKDNSDKGSDVVIDGYARTIREALPAKEVDVGLQQIIQSQKQTFDALLKKYKELEKKQPQSVDVEGLKKEIVSYLLLKEVDNVTAKCMQGNFSFNKAQGKFEYYTNLILNHLNEQGYFNGGLEQTFVKDAIKHLEIMKEEPQSTEEADISHVLTCLYLALPQPPKKEGE